MKVYLCCLLAIPLVSQGKFLDSYLERANCFGKQLTIVQFCREGSSNLDYSFVAIVLLIVGAQFSVFFSGNQSGLCPGQEIMFSCVANDSVLWIVQVEENPPSYTHIFDVNDDQQTASFGPAQAAVVAVIDSITLVSVLRFNPQNTPTVATTVKCNNFDPHTEFPAGQSYFDRGFIAITYRELCHSLWSRIICHSTCLSYSSLQAMLL